MPGQRRWVPVQRKNVSGAQPKTLSGPTHFKAAAISCGFCGEPHNSNRDRGLLLRDRDFPERSGSLLETSKGTTESIAANHLFTPSSFLNTLPSFITKSTFPRILTFAKGSPETATISA